MLDAIFGRIRRRLFQQDFFGSSWATKVPPVIPALTMALGQTYYIRARQTFATLGVGLWSADVVINT